MFYMIKWEGFSDAENTWEPMENLQACQHLIEAFERKRGNFFKRPSGHQEYEGRAPEKRVKTNTDHYQSEKQQRNEISEYLKDRLISKIHSKNGKVKEKVQLEIDLETKIRPSRNDSYDLVLKNKQERQTEAKVQYQGNTSGIPSQSELRTGPNHHRRYPKNSKAADLSCYDISSSEGHYQEREMNRVQNTSTKFKAKNRSPKHKPSPRKPQSRPKNETNNALPKLGRRTFPQFKEDSYKSCSQVVSSNESSVILEYDLKKRKPGDQPAAKIQTDQEINPSLFQNSSGPAHKLSSDEELRDLSEYIPAIATENQEQPLEILHHSVDAEINLEKESEGVLVADTAEDNKSASDVPSIMELEKIAKARKKELDKTSEVEHKVFENLSRFETEISEHLVIEGEMWLGVSLNTEAGWKHIGYFSKDLCKQRIPTQLCNFYEKFLKIS